MAKFFYAVVARNQAECGLAANALEETDFWNDEIEFRSFTIIGGGIEMGATWAENTNVFHADLAPVFDLIYVDNRVTLPAGGWSASFISYLARMLKPGGRLAFELPPARRNNCQLCRTDVDDIIGQTGELMHETLSVYQPRSPITADDSILDWYVQNYGSIIIDLVSENSPDELHAVAEDSVMIDLMGEPLAAEQLGELSYGNGMPDQTPYRPVAELVKDYVASMAYLFHGIGYKSAVIAEIIRSQIGTETQIDYLDIGGANGALAAEVLLRKDISVRTARTHELLLRYLPGAAKIYRSNIENFESRLRFTLGSMTDFDFPAPYNVVSFIGCLYLAGPENHESVVSAAMSNLSLGGLLIVHENLRDNRKVPSHDYMFSEEQLYSLLSGFGEVKLYHTLTGREITKESLKGKTVFWSVQKNG